MAKPSVTASSAAPSKPERLPTTVDKPTPYLYDLAYLTAVDPNPLPATSASLLSQPAAERSRTLQQIARDGAQSLLTTLLTTCPIKSTPDGLVMTLPRPTNQLPRWKPLPKPKAPTKWELFARKKGIGKKFGGSLKGGAALGERRKNMVYDEEKGEWVKKWGFQGKNKNGETDWLVELDEGTVRREKDGFGGGDAGKTVRGEGRRERVERIRRQDRRQRNNDRKTRKGGKAG